MKTTKRQSALCLHPRRQSVSATSRVPPPWSTSSPPRRALYGLFVLPPVLALVFAHVSLAALPQGVPSPSPSPRSRAPSEPQVLARVEIASFQVPLPLPTHALLQDSDRRDYALVFAMEAELDQLGRPWRELAGGVAPEECLLATQIRAGARLKAAASCEILHDDGIRLLIRANAEQAEQLAESGFALQRLTGAPMTWPSATASPFAAPRIHRKWDPDPLVAGMISTIQPTNLFTLVARLSGVEPVLTGGKPQRLTTRHTTSGLPLTNALAWAYARLDALNLAPVYHSWSASGYSGRNLVATLPGGARSNELVLITAHLDDMPAGALAPGADDNASGSAAVLIAAGVFSQYEFERTIRFVLFTGEEQGLLGSASYALAARNNGDNIVAVLNLDMIGWDSGKPSTFQLHTRTTSNPGYSSDLPIATTFTNVVFTYGLTAIAPVIRADGLNRSDHYSFWNRNYPAVAGTEDYSSDFNPYYHGVGDTVTRLNMPYFTDAVRAAVATVAHLAQPLGRTSSAVLEVANSDWSLTSGIGGSVLLTRHLPGAGETDLEAFDLPFTNAPPNPNSRWLRLDTVPYGIELVVDSRSTLSESIFTAELAAMANEGLTVTGSNKLRFDFLSPPDPDRIYLARVRVSPQFSPDPTPFLCVTNLREVVASGGYLGLPNLAGATPGVQYGTCEVAARFLDTTAAACPLSLLSVTGSNWVFATRAQAGTRVRDEIEFTTELPATNWSVLGSVERKVEATETNFDAGWQDIQWPIDPSSLPASPRHYFRLKRTWLAWE